MSQPLPTRRPTRAALRLSALSIWGAMGMVEVLDGFSKDYKFSWQDFIANSIGAGLGYFFEGNREWDDILDFRFSYRQTPISSDWDPPWPGRPTAETSRNSKNSQKLALAFSCCHSACGSRHWLLYPGSKKRQFRQHLRSE